MPRFLLVLMLAIAGHALPPAPAARAEELIFRAFDPAALVQSEKRLLQTALAATGDYEGELDGAWGRASQAAMETYASREFADAARNVHAAALMLGFEQEVERHGWGLRDLHGFGISLALPRALLGDLVRVDGGQHWSAPDGSLSVLVTRFGPRQAALWHDAAAASNARRGSLRRQRGAKVLVTTGELTGGSRFFTRSDRVDGRWTTVHLAAGPGAAAALNLIAASIRPGPPVPWTLPADGRLAGIVAETGALLDTARRRSPEILPEPANAPMPVPVPAALPPRTSKLPGTEGMTATGTGFFIGTHVLVTADHVVTGCNRIALPDGTELAVIATDPEIDVAALHAPAPARAWLALAGRAHPRLGQRLHAAGFPYYSLAGTSLHLTGGNVSALAGVDDDRRFFSFTAPVQPGNSGGPLIGPQGTVLGLAVARLSETFIAEATGSLPQNMNYALSAAELAGFLARNGLEPAADGLGGYDMDAGAPDGFEAAVVPIVCE